MVQGGWKWGTAAYLVGLELAALEDLLDDLILIVRAKLVGEGSLGSTIVGASHARTVIDSQILASNQGGHLHYCRGGCGRRG